MTEFKVLYNPLAGNADTETTKAHLKGLLSDTKLEFIDITKIENLSKFLKTLPEKVNILLVGGDGTLNRFINTDGACALGDRVYFYAAGSGNDFWVDLGKKVGDAPVCIGEYIKNLPTAEVNGKTYKFINGAGYGLDGWCCEVADILKAKGKKVNYTSIAIKGCLFSFKPANATVTVDGVTQVFKKCWIAPAMNGKFYGGGMMVTPEQDRLQGGKISVCIMHGSGRLKTLTVFPTVFKGEHIKHTKIVKVLSGKEITVKFDKPCALQLDGETILNVTEYTAKASN